MPATLEPFPVIRGLSTHAHNIKASTCPLIDILGLYLMSKAARDIPYLAILLKKSAHLSKDYKGCFVSTITV